MMNSATRQTLLTQYGSPLYLYDLASVQAAHEALRTALPVQSVLYYSLKANPHPALVTELMRLGCRAEISSAGELQAAQAGNGTADALYTGPGKTIREITLALQQGVRHFSTDSPTDLERITQCAQAASTPVKIVLRINPSRAVGGLGLIMTGVPSQFGIDAEWIQRAPELFASRPWAQIVGFHIYMGTNISSCETLLQTFEVASETAAQLADTLRIEPEIIDLGGGFGHPFATQGARPDFSALRIPLERLLDDRFPGWRDGRPQIAFESGRYLTAQSGTLFCTIQDIKVSQGQTFVITDSGIHHLGGMAGLRRVPSIGAGTTRIDAQDTDAILTNVNVVGALCTPLDQWARGADIPSFSQDERMAIPNVGAYGLTGSLLTFLSRETPVEVILDGDEVKEASQLVMTRRAPE